MVTGWGDPQRPAVVPVIVEFTSDETELLTAAVELRTVGAEIPAAEPAEGLP